MSAECVTVTCADKLSRDEDFLNWLRDHGLEPNVIHTVHVYDDHMTVEGYELNADGRKFYDIDRRGPAEFEPFDVTLKERMPSVPPPPEGRKPKTAEVTVKVADLPRTKALIAQLAQERDEAEERYEELLAEIGGVSPR